ncbi:MAG: C40 family peptidase [Lachnospiraceae bacterium]|nr:C40 family peptidase [Lachnospiraceae bacterium]
MKKRFLMLFIASVLTITPTMNVMAVTKNEVQAQKKEAQKNLEVVNNNIESIEVNRDAIEEEIVEIDAQLVDLLLTVDLISGDIELKQSAINDAQAEYEAAKNKEAEQYESMKKRIKFMYEKGEKKYVEMFLQSQSLAEIVNKTDYVELLYEYDREMLLNYQQTKEQEAQIKERLENEKNELVEMQNEYVEESKNLEKVIDEKKSSLANFDAQLKAAQNKANEYQLQIKQQTAVLKQIEADEAKKKAEEEARKKAEAEAKKKLEEEAKKIDETKEASNEVNKQEDAAAVNKSDQNEQNSEEASKDSTNNNAEETEAVSNTEEKKETETVSTQSQTPASPGDSAKGQEIANYACNFIGNPYVSGGNSLTDGCDCSGFTCAVYQKYGYSLPRSSYSQSTYGREVSYAEAQPGDIIYYGGHVGIYLGGGKIVHASTPATGIKISNALYRSIITIRRIV